MNSSQTDVTEALRQLKTLAEQTREQLRELLHMVSPDALSMTYTQLFHVDEALVKLARLDRKHTKETIRE